MPIFVKTTRQMKIAAKLAAMAEPSDPFAYGRALANLRQGLDDPKEMAAWAAKRMNMTTSAAVALAAA